MQTPVAQTMKSRTGFRILVGAAVMVCAALAAVFFLPTTEQRVPVPVIAVDATESMTQHHLWTHNARAGSGRADAPVNDAATSGIDDTVPAELRQQFADIARVYTENARYPSYATPLHQNDWAQLNPRAFVPRATALKNMPGVTVSVQLDHYIVDRDTDLPVRVVVAPEQGATDIPMVSAVQVQLQKAGSSPVVALLLGDEMSDGDMQVFSGVLPAAALRAVPAGETVLVARVSFAQAESAVVTAMVKTYESDARLLRVGSTRIDGADLVIPAVFDVKAPGLYRVAANLFAADGKTPVSHLNAEFQLAAGSSTQPLKVHAVTLRAKGDAGPYVLRDIDITRAPDAPGDATGYGSSAADRYDVRGFPLAAYSEEAWVDPENEQRQKFLEKLANAK